MNACPVSLRYQLGASYIEVVVATLLIAITLVPAMEALQSGIKGADSHENYATDHYQLIGKFEEVLAQPFNTLLSASTVAGNNTTASAYSDLPGTANCRIVYLSFYDADNSDGDGNLFSIADANTDGDNNPYTGDDVDISLLWVRAEIEGSTHSVETLVSR